MKLKLWHEGNLLNNKWKVNLVGIVVSTSEVEWSIIISAFCELSNSNGTTAVSSEMKKKQRGPLNNGKNELYWKLTFHFLPFTPICWAIVSRPAMLELSQRSWPMELTLRKVIQYIWPKIAVSKLSGFREWLPIKGYFCMAYINIKTKQVVLVPKV